ncbi:hypothetical protein MKW98_002985, partial [Papaver atlanticum]
ELFFFGQLYKSYIKTMKFGVPIFRHPTPKFAHKFYWKFLELDFRFGFFFFNLSIDTIYLHFIVCSPLSNLKYGKDNIIFGWDLLVQFVTYEINARSCEVLRRTSKTFPGGFSGELSNVSNDMLVALDPTGFHQTAISDLIGNFSGMASIFPSKLIKHEGQQAFGVVQNGESKISITVKQATDWSSGNLVKETIVMDQKRGNVEKLWALIVMEDLSLLLLQQGEIVWSRDDGFASILDMTTSEPFRHLLKLKGALMLATPEDIVAIQGMRLKSSQKMPTRAGKIFALHTGDGRVVNLPNPTGLNLYQWQVPHQNALDENPSVLVVGSCGGSNAPGHSIDHIIPPPVTDSNRKGHAFLYPRTPEALKLCQVELLNIYWYLIESCSEKIVASAMRNLNETPAEKSTNAHTVDPVVIWLFILHKFQLQHLFIQRSDLLEPPEL